MVGDAPADQMHDPIEAEVQRFLGELERASPDVQALIVARLLSGLAGKLTSTVATKAIGAAKEPPQPGGQRGPKAKPRPAKTTKGEEFARIDSQLARLSDPADPMLAWRTFGGTAAALYEVLRYEPLGVLEAMVLHDHMPPGPRPRGKSREVLAQTIANRLAAHFGAS